MKKIILILLIGCYSIVISKSNHKSYNDQFEIHQKASVDQAMDNIEMEAMNKINILFDIAEVSYSAGYKCGKAIKKIIFENEEDKDKE